MECDEVAEWLRRWTANPMGSARVGSNPILVGSFFTHPMGDITEDIISMCVSYTFSWYREELLSKLTWQTRKKGFRYRESNPGLLGESQLS